MVIMCKRITVVGSFNMDMIIKVAHIPAPGETIIGGDFATAAGGKGANQAVAALRAGGNVAFIARIGNDMFGDQAMQAFTNDGLPTEYIIRDPEAPSGAGLIYVADDGENCIAVAPGANSNLSSQDVEAAKELIASSSLLLLQLETPPETIHAAAAVAAGAGVPIILDPAPARPLDAEFLSLVSIMTPNETEAELLSGIRVTDERSAREAAKVLLEKGIATVTITLGAKGTLVAGSGAIEMVPGFRVEAVDTTAAGDTFAGALAVALSEERELMEAVRFANAAAALSVTKLGAQPSIPLRTEIDAFLNSQ